jgi:hypothetical protein
MAVNTITAGACVWGDVYWPRFGKRWLDSVYITDPAPDQIMIVSDRHIEVPSDVRLIVEPEVSFNAWNIFAQHCETTWIGGIGIDDEYVRDSFIDIDSDRDAIAFCCQQAGEATSIACPAGEDAYIITHNLPNNPMNGGQFWRTSSLLEIPIRAGYIYCDEVLWAEWAYFGMKIKFENRVRQIWHRWSGANSWPANGLGESQAQEFKAKLRAGLIQKGVPE